MPIYTSRAAKIMALVPKCPFDSGEEDDDAMSDDEMMKRLDNLFDIELSSDQKEDEVLPEDSGMDVDLPQVEDVNLVDSDGPVEEELQYAERSSEEDEVAWEDNDSNDRAGNDNPESSDMPGPSTLDKSSSIQPRKQKKSKFNRVRLLKKPALKNEEKEKKKFFKWKKEPFGYCVELPDQYVSTELVTDEASSPLGYFKKFFTGELIQMIADESNRYSIQQKGTSAGITSNDIRDFLAIEISMGIVKIRSWKSYWSSETRVDRVAKVMSRNKYAKIRSSLHFVDNNNNNIDPNDRYFKIRPIAEYLRQKFLSIEAMDRKFSVDEMMIGYKGKKAGSRRQYMPKKPTKWGFKVFARCGTSGIVYDFFYYAGDQSFHHIPFNAKEIAENFSTKCVLALCKSIKDPALSAMFFDNYFSSPRLIRLLRNEYGILSLGTLRANRLQGAGELLARDKELLRRGRGSYDVVSDNSKKITIVKWGVVTLGSSYVGVEPLGAVSRWSAQAKKKSSVTCPKIVKEYNSFMGGVDKTNMLTALYKTPLRTFKWYMVLFAHLIDLSLSNAWLLYLKENPEKKMSLVDFKIDVSNSLVVHKRMKRISIDVVSPNPCAEQRLEGAQHLPVPQKKGKCRLCHNNQTIWSCLSCMVRLCLTPHRNCFQSYHTERELPKRKYTRKAWKSDKGASEEENGNLDEE